MRCLTGYLWLLAGAWISACAAEHLEPMPVTGPGSLGREYVGSLEGSEGSPLWMIVRPSYSVGYDIFIHRDVSHELTHRGPAVPFLLPDPQAPSERSEKAPVVSKGWFLEWVSDYSYERRRIQIDELLVKDLLGAWEIVLKQARYGSSESSGTDGATYYFQCRGGSGEAYAGRTHSPSGGAARDLVRLGELLGEIPLKDVASRIALIELVRVEASRIREMGER